MLDLAASLKITAGELLGPAGELRKIHVNAPKPKPSCKRPRRIYPMTF